MDIFAGTAEYYDQYRPGVPDALRDVILEEVAAPVTLLDLGTGTGRVLEQFAPSFSDIIAVEPSNDMLTLARRRLHAYPVHFMNCSAEDLRMPADWHASLVTICRAFHWMNRSLVLRKLDRIVAPRGVIAVFNEDSFWEVQEPWAEAVRRVLKKFAGNERQTVRGAYQAPPHPYAQDFADSAFSDFVQRRIPMVRYWTSDDIIGYLFSTSFASKELLGSRAERFEETLRRELTALSPNDLFTEDNTFEVLIARRPTPIAP